MFMEVTTCAYHPWLAAEIVDREERVDTRDAAKMQADDQVPEVLTGNHAVGVLANQYEVWLEGPAERQARQQRVSWGIKIRLNPFTPELQLRC